MTSTIKQPTCIYCGRGKKHSPASIGGNGPFYLIPSEVRKNGKYQGKTWNCFCGSCFKKILYKYTSYSSILDFMNLFNTIEIEIIIEEQNVILSIFR